MLRVLMLCVGLLTLGGLSGSSTAEADPIPILITAGTMTGDLNGGRVELASSMRGFSLLGFGDGAGEWGCRGDCRPGESLRLDALWSGSDLSGTLSIDGSTYQLGMVTDHTVYADVAFRGSWIAPSFVGAATATLVSPFSFTGWFLYPDVPGIVIPPETLLGQGLATLDLSWNPVHEGWNLEGARYVFEAPTEPVPEPATMLLLGSGLAGLGVIRRRRSRLTAHHD